MARPNAFLREDFRRDGLFANFLATADLMIDLARSIPGSRINVGYPAICAAERHACQTIMHALRDSPTEQALVGHCSPSHLRVMSELANSVPNSSANFWIPTSDIAIARLRANCNARDVLHLAYQMLKLWHRLSDRPIDVALVDATAAATTRPARIPFFVRALHQNGARSVIICDSCGSSTPGSIGCLFASLRSSFGQIEFHPHNDSGLAVECADIACRHGATHIGSSAFGISERLNMLDVRQLLPAINIPFDPDYYVRFARRYDHDLVGVAGRSELLQPSVVVTGTQRLLLATSSPTFLRFGVTSDRKMTQLLASCAPSQITSSTIRAMKDSLYTDRRAYIPNDELAKLLGDARRTRHALTTLP